MLASTKKTYNRRVTTTVNKSFYSCPDHTLETIDVQLAAKQMHQSLTSKKEVGPSVPWLRMALQGSLRGGKVLKGFPWMPWFGKLFKHKLK